MNIKIYGKNLWQFATKMKRFLRKYSGLNVGEVISFNMNIYFVK